MEPGAPLEPGGRGGTAASLAMDLDAPTERTAGWRRLALRGLTLAVVLGVVPAMVQSIALATGQSGSRGPALVGLAAGFVFIGLIGGAIEGLVAMSGRWGGPRRHVLVTLAGGLLGGAGILGGGFECLYAEGAVAGGLEGGLAAVVETAGALWHVLLSQPLGLGKTLLPLTLPFGLLALARSVEMSRGAVAQTILVGTVFLSIPVMLLPPETIHAAPTVSVDTMLGGSVAWFLGAVVALASMIGDTLERRLLGLERGAAGGIAGPPGR